MLLLQSPASGPDPEPIEHEGRLRSIVILLPPTIIVILRSFTIGHIPLALTRDILAVWWKPCLDMSDDEGAQLLVPSAKSVPGSLCR